MNFTQSEIICESFWQFFSSCEWSNKQTFFLEIILAITITIIIGFLFYRLEKKRHKIRQQYALFQIRSPLEAEYENIKLIEKIIKNKLIPPNDENVKKENFEFILQLLNGIEKEIKEIDTLSQILHFDIDPKIEEKIHLIHNAVMGFSKGFPHWSPYVSPSDQGIIEKFTELFDIVRQESDKFRKQS